MIEDTELKVRLSSRRIGRGPIDCDIHPGITSVGEFAPYLPKRWAEHLLEYGMFLRQTYASATSYPRLAKDTAKADAWPPSGLPPGADLPFLREQLLDAKDTAYGILQPLRPATASERNLDFSVAMATAHNNWQIAKWIEPEPRLKGSIVVAQEEPEAAVRELERCAAIGGFVQLTLPPKAIEPLGRKRYWPIYEACADLRLPIGFHVSGISGHAVTPAGWPSFYIEDHNANILAIQATATSLIFEGVLERWPSLMIVLIEGGASWSLALGARMDRAWTIFRSELPHLPRPPSSYLRENFRFTTQPVEEPMKVEHALATMREIGIDRLMYSSDYPHWDGDEPKFVVPRGMTPTEAERLLRLNASELYGLPL